MCLDKFWGEIVTIYVLSIFPFLVFFLWCSAFYRFNDEVKHIKVIEKDSWIHITEAKKFESLLVSHMFSCPLKVSVKISSRCAKARIYSFIFFYPSLSFFFFFGFTITGAGGVLSVPFTQRKLQVVRHHAAIPLQVERTLVNSGQHPLTRWDSKRSHSPVHH